MSASNYQENLVLDFSLGSGTPATVYLSLHTADPGETGANETTGTNYARKSVTNNSTNWPAASSGVKLLHVAQSFATPGAGGWGTVTYFGIWDAASAGNFMFGGQLTISKTINQDDAVSFAIDALSVTAE
jgi:hypothetical protein